MRKTQAVLMNSLSVIATLSFGTYTGLAAGDSAAGQQFFTTHCGLFESVWGPQAFAIAWPSDVEQVCARPGPPPAGDPQPVHLGPLDRGRVATTFDQLAQSIAGYEISAEVTVFTSKFDAVLAGKAQFTKQEQAGYDLHC